MSEELIGIVLADAGERMNEAVAAARREFSTVRTGRANSALLERVQVEAYGVKMAMRELVSFAIPEASQLIVTPHDPANITAVERAIQQAQLGLVPSNDGRVIRLSFPPLTEERRRELARLVGLDGGGLPQPGPRPAPPGPQGSRRCREGGWGVR